MLQKDLYSLLEMRKRIELFQQIARPNMSESDLIINLWDPLFTDLFPDKYFQRTKEQDIIITAGSPGKKYRPDLMIKFKFDISKGGAKMMHHSSVHLPTIIVEYQVSPIAPFVRHKDESKIATEISFLW